MLLFLLVYPQWILSNCICDKYKTIGYSQIGKITGINSTNSISLQITDLRFDNIEDFKNYLQTNNVTVVYNKRNYSVNEPYHTIEELPYEKLKTYPYVTNISTNSEVKPLIESKVLGWN